MLPTSRPGASPQFSPRLWGSRVLQVAGRRRHANTRASGCCGAVATGHLAARRGRPRCSCPIGYARGVTRAQRGSGRLRFHGLLLACHASPNLGGTPPQYQLASASAHSAAQGRSSAGIGAGGANPDDSGRIGAIGRPSQSRSGAVFTYRGVYRGGAYIQTCGVGMHLVRLRRASAGTPLLASSHGTLQMKPSAAAEA